MKFSVAIFMLFSILICKISFAQTTPIAITQVSDLNFGTAFLGDPVKTVNRGASENAENASFLVTGDAGATFNLTQPGRIWMDHSSSNDRIRVRRFTSRPSSSGSIGNNGELLIFVGATRNAIPTNISTGSYSGTFTITVVY